MKGGRHFGELVDAAPVNFEQPKVDWAGVAELMQAQAIKPAEVVAVSWCRFSTANIEALVDSTSIAIDSVLTNGMQAGVDRLAREDGQ
jgi:hypothetical protein